MMQAEAPRRIFNASSELMLGTTTESVSITVSAGVDGK